MAAQIIPVIMCGGAGTRLWPVSRESMPKQFVPLVGQASTFQQVLTRVSDAELLAVRSLSPRTTFASWWRSNCASAASRRTWRSSRCAAIPLRRSRLPPARGRARPQCPGAGASIN